MDGSNGKNDDVSHISFGNVFVFFFNQKLYVVCTFFILCYVHA